MALQFAGIKTSLPTDQIGAYFGAYGQVWRVIRTGTGLQAPGVVEFVDRKAAEAAAAHCLGLIDIDGVAVKVSWAKPKQPEANNKS